MPSTKQINRNLNVTGDVTMDKSLIVKNRIASSNIHVTSKDGLKISGINASRPVTIGELIDERIDEKLKDQTKEINKKIEIQTEGMEDDLLRGANEHLDNKVTSQVDEAENALRKSMENQVAEEVNSQIRTLTRQNVTTTFKNDNEDLGMTSDRPSTGENPSNEKESLVLSAPSPVIESPSTLARGSDVKSVAKDASETNVKTDAEPAPAPAPEAPAETGTGGNAGAPRTSETNVKPVDEASGASVINKDNLGAAAGGKRMGRKTKKRKTKKTKVRKIKKGSKKTKVKRNTRKSKKGRK